MSSCGGLFDVGAEVAITLKRARPGCDVFCQVDRERTRLPQASKFWGLSHEVGSDPGPA